MAPWVKWILGKHERLNSCTQNSQVIICLNINMKHANVILKEEISAEKMSPSSSPVVHFPDDWYRCTHPTRDGTILDGWPWMIKERRLNEP